MRVLRVRVCVCAVCVLRVRVRYVCVCACVRVCAFVCWNATFQVFHFCSACCCCIMSVSHRSSSSQALYFVAATVQRQSHIELFLFAAGSDGASVCTCACHVSHILSREMQGCSAGGRAIQTHTYFLGISRATARPRLQYQYNSTIASSSGLCESHGAFVLICVCSVHQEIFINVLNQT